MESEPPYFASRISIALCAPVLVTMTDLLAVRIFKRNMFEVSGCTGGVKPAGPATDDP
jgi:hypothetical protein